MDAGLSGVPGCMSSSKAPNTCMSLSPRGFGSVQSEPLPDWFPRRRPIRCSRHLIAAFHRFHDLVLHLRVETGPPLAEALPRLQLGKNSVGNLSGLIHLVIHYGGERRMLEHRTVKRTHIRQP